jgi:RNA polymerase sigma-70 factor (ECF subfamily)
MSETAPQGAPEPEDRPSSPLDSIHLVRQAQQGELSAYERLFERYYERVRGLARKRLGPGLREQVETVDIVNDAMVEAIRSFQDYEIRDDKKILAWFAGIVENRIRALDRHYRAQKRDRAKQQALDYINESISMGRLSLQPAVEEPSPSTVVRKREEIDVLRECLDALPEKSREIVRLKHAGEHSWEEIAELAGCASADAARMIYARAKIELSKAMKKRLGED